MFGKTPVAWVEATLLLRPFLRHRSKPVRKLLVRSFLAGLLLYILGGISNELVIWLNGGFMPVQNYPGCDAFPGTIIDSMHSCASAANHLRSEERRVGKECR